MASCFHLRRDLFFDAVRRTLLLHLRQHAVARGPPDRFAHREDSRGDVFHRLGLNFNGVVKAFDGANNVRVIALGSSFNVYGLGTNSQMGVFTARDTSLILGLLQMNASGTDDRLQLWVDPNVGLGEADVLAK